MLIATISVECSAEELKKVQANEILAKIQNGQPVDYDHVIIIDDLDISKANLNMRQGGSDEVKKVLPDIRIGYSRIEGKLNLDNIIIEGSTNFRNTNFQWYLRVSGDLSSTALLILVGRISPKPATSITLCSTAIHASGKLSSMMMPILSGLCLTALLILTGPISPKLATSITLGSTSMRAS